jgi:DNA-binding Lrp family transcriptional regulator
VICEGCRARAYAAVGDYLEAEPFCTYQPLSPVDKKLLNELQFNFPLIAAPYAEIAARIGLSEEETLRRVEKLKKNKLIRRIGPTFEAGKLGYVNTLVAMKVPAAELDRAGDLVSRYEEVTHNYAREGEYNLWFTLTSANGERERSIISEIKSSLGCQNIHSLPTLKKFKINARFTL